MSFALTTIITVGALALISAALLTLANHLEKKEPVIRSPKSWAIIDGEYIYLDPKEEA